MTAEMTADNPALILASASARRVELLKQLNLPFEQVVSPHEEPPQKAQTPKPGLCNLL